MKKIIILFSMLCLTLAALMLVGCEHRHREKSEWTVTEFPTCTTRGGEILECMDCGEVLDARVLKPLGHSYGEWTVEEPATCMKEGRKSSICVRCNKSQTEVIEKTQHKFGEWEGEPAACVKDGFRTRVCEICDTPETEMLPATGHNIGEEDWEVIVSASCTSDGYKEAYCDRCEQTFREEIKTTGHNYALAFTLDLEPTESSVGYKSHHCKNKGCTSKQDVTELPAGSDVWVSYRVEVSKTSGRNFITAAPTFAFYNLDDEAVFRRAGPTGEAVSAVTTTKLFRDTYQVELELPEEFGAEEYYEISGYDQSGNELSEPTLKIILDIRLSEDTNSSIREKAVMSDLSLTTVGGEEIHLSELLKTKKLVILNFYYNRCYYCMKDSTYLNTAYQTYRDDIAVICFNTQDKAEDIKHNAKYDSQQEFRYNEEFYFVADRNLGTYKRVADFQGTPCDVYIDGDGVICKVTLGAQGASIIDEVRKIIQG